MVDWEKSFNYWAAPPSDTETAKIENAERAIREAIASNNALSSRNYSIFVQGSYRNRVNVKQDSDVDIGIVCRDTFFHEGANQVLLASFTPATYEYSEYKVDIHAAASDYFGYNSISVGDKALDIKANTNRVEADLACFFEYRWYYNSVAYHSGVVMFDAFWNKIINWPEQHYDNGVSKNRKTGKRYKKCVRILKKLKIKMAENGNDLAETIPGFLIECLVYNVSSDHFQNNTLMSDIKNCLFQIYDGTENDQKCQEWTEVSGLKFLFNNGQKWSRQQAHQFACDAWNYIGFS